MLPKIPVSTLIKFDKLKKKPLVGDDSTIGRRRSRAENDQDVYSTLTSFSYLLKLESLEECYSMLLKKSLLIAKTISDIFVLNTKNLERAG